MSTDWRTDLVEAINDGHFLAPMAPPPLRPCDPTDAHHTWLLGDLLNPGELERCLCGRRLFRDLARTGDIFQGAPFLSSWQVRRAEH